jgi:Ca2+-binding RTX toxin-like protein
MGSLRDRRANVIDTEKFQAAFKSQESAGMVDRFVDFSASSSSTSATSAASRGAIAGLAAKPEFSASATEGHFFVGACACPACGSAISYDKDANTLARPQAEFNAADLAGAISVPGEILLDGTISGTEIDFYAITLVAGQTYTFSAFGSGATPLTDTILLVFDHTAGDFVSGGYSFFPELADDDGGAGTASLFTYTAANSGTYSIGVGAFAGTGQYTLDAVVQSAIDVPDTFSGAAPIVVGTTQYGFIEAGPDSFYSDLIGVPMGEIDTFRIEATAGMIYTIEVAGGADYNSFFLDLPPGELDTFIVLYDSEGNFVTLNDDINFLAGDLGSRISFFAETDGTYFLDVFSYQPWTGGYSITSQAIDPLDFDPLDSLIWARASNVPFDASNTAYVYFAAAGENFGETQGDSNAPLVSLGWNDYEIGQVMLALEEYERILGVNYVVTTDVNQATFRLITTEDEPYGAYMYPQDPTFGTQQGIAAFNVDSGGWRDFQQSLEQGGFSFAVILHEFGHGHGLSHPHDRGGGSDVMLGVTAAQGSLGIYDLNQGVYTVMSYNDAWQTHPDGPSPFTVAGIDNGWSGTLGAFDIAALQRRYGVINPYAVGDTVYQIKDTNDAGTYYETIWDTGGVDVIRYDGVRSARIDLLAATIDYTPTGGGVVSFVDGIWGGYTIAQGVVIENATGGSGNDQLLGNSAANTLRGNAGDDILVGREGGDRLIGGAGVDTASYVGAASGVVASLQDEEDNTGDAAGDTYSGIENLQGSRHNDVLDGNDGANQIDGGNGDDSLRGRDGGDTLIGGAGNDTLRGDDGKDTLNGGAGNDVLSGGDGVDTLIGGSGNDRFTGGDGKDGFVFNSGSGADTVTDFRRGQDTLDLTGTGISWADLDSNGNGALDNADAFVAVIAGRMIIDLGAADGGAADLDTLTLLGINRLTQDSFLFGP